MPRLIVVLISWTALSCLNLLFFVNGIIEKLYGNPKFLTPPVTKIELQAAYDLVNSTYANHLKGEDEKQQYEDAMSALDVMLHSLALYINPIANGDRQLILSTGFEATTGVIVAAVKPGTPAAVLLKSIAGGSLHMSIGEIPGADSYVFIVYCGSPTSPALSSDECITLPPNVQNVYIITDGNLSETLTNLPIGTHAFVQALAQNSAGKSSFGPITSIFLN